MGQLAQEREYRLHAELSPGGDCGGRFRVKEELGPSLLRAVCDGCGEELGVRPRDLERHEQLQEFTADDDRRWWDR